MSYYKIDRRGWIYSNVDGDLNHNGITHDPACLHGSDPLIAVMEEMASVSSKHWVEDGETTGLVISSAWMEDRVFYSWDCYPPDNKFGTFHTVIKYPYTLLATCLACGSVCSYEAKICKRCRPLIAEIIEEEKENRRIQKEVKELQRTIKQFEDRLNERYRRHQNQATGPLAEVRQGRTRRSRGENSHRIRKSNA